MKDDLVGWQVKQADWHFCARLYLKWNIVLEYGEYSTIIKTIQRGFGDRYPGIIPGTTIYHIPFRALYLPIVGKKRGTRLISVLGAGEFKRRQRLLRGEPTISAG